MGALTEIYVDPAGNANSGAGTIGSPYLDLQYALNTATRDATNGNRINIKAGTAEVLTASLSFATFGAPGPGAQCILEGYTSTAGDGGIGDLNGNNGNFVIYASAQPHVTFKNLILRNTGTASVVQLGQYNSIISCEVHTSDEDGIKAWLNAPLVLNCNIYNINRFGIHANSSNGTIYGNYLADSTKTFDSAIRYDGAGIKVERNIITLTGNGYGISDVSYYCEVVHNSILAAGSTGCGIDAAGGEGPAFAPGYLNNLIEGFSGAGGCGIKHSNASDLKHMIHNAVYNCTTAYSLSDLAFVNIDNETLGASPFAKSGSNTFANRFTYFAPVNTGNVWAGAYPVGSGLDKGACQHAGGGAAPPNFNILTRTA